MDVLLTVLGEEAEARRHEDHGLVVGRGDRVGLVDLGDVLLLGSCEARLEMGVVAVVEPVGEREVGANRESNAQADLPEALQERDDLRETKSDAGDRTKRSKRSESECRGHQ